MKKLDEVSISIDNKGAYDSEGTLVFDPDQGVWVFWPAGIDDGVSYERDLDDTLSEMADDYDADLYALDAKHGRAVIITPAAETAGLDVDMDLAGYTVVAI